MYLETMERILGNSDKVIMDTGQGGSGVVPYLPLKELSGSQTEPRPSPRSSPSQPSGNSSQTQPGGGQ